MRFRTNTAVLRPKSAMNLRYAGRHMCNTSGRKIGLLALPLAQVQAAHLGYPGTIGVRV